LGLLRDLDLLVARETSDLDPERARVGGDAGVARPQLCRVDLAHLRSKSQFLCLHTKADGLLNELIY
jgi:hypothetical protein